jgi:hypothetical protein
VLRIPGWERSSGVNREIAFFKAQGKPIKYIDAEDQPQPGQ